MEILGYIALILLTLVGYSGGVVGKAGRSVVIKPQVIDLFLILILWVAGFASKLTVALNKWLLVFLWVIFAILVGICRAFLRKKAKDTKSVPEEPDDLPSNFVRRLWSTWERFGHRLGSFQSLVILSFLFFIIVSPFAIAVKWFSDPLRIKRQTQKSFWHIRGEERPDIEHYRRQF
jgi:hypothetical protein